MLVSEFCAYNRKPVRNRKFCGMIGMSIRTVQLEDVKGRTLEEVLKEVLGKDEALNVRFQDGRGETIQPSVALQPLPELEDSVPSGWKDAVYTESA